MPGIEITELLPRLAKMADKFTILRSLHHQRGEHSGGTHRFLTGYSSRRRQPAQRGVSRDRLRRRQATGSAKTRDVPLFVGNTQVLRRRPGLSWAGDAPFMPKPTIRISSTGNNTYDPIPIYPPDDRRRGLPLTADSTLLLEHAPICWISSTAFATRRNDRPSLDTWDRHQRRAVEMLAGRTTREAFDLSREPRSASAAATATRTGARAC